MGETKTIVLDNIRSRRSTRNYIDKPVSDELLNEIIEAGRYAPSGNNTQLTHFFVITNKNKLAELRQIITGVLANMPEREGMPPMLINLMNRAKQGEVDVSYGAPALIITANRKGNGNAAFDIACALENMMLAATAANIGHCWINQLYHLREVPAIRSFFAELGLDEDEEIYGSLALGYSDRIETDPLPRTGYIVTYVK